MTKVFARRFCATRLSNSTKKKALRFDEFMGLYEGVAIFFISQSLEAKVFFLAMVFHEMHFILILGPNGTARLFNKG